MPFKAGDPVIYQGRKWIVRYLMRRPGDTVFFTGAVIHRDGEVAYVNTEDLRLNLSVMAPETKMVH